jgi:hypothetical protein
MLSTVWLDHVAAMDALMLVACCNSTSSILAKVACSWPSAILGRFWVGGWVVLCGGGLRWGFISWSREMLAESPW